MKTHGRQIVHPPAVAGLFYPAEPQILAQDVDRMLAMARPEISTGRAGDLRIKALIVPHAGYRYSGQIAAAAYAQIADYAGELTRVVMLGPAHRLAFKGLATSTADQFMTPLGAVHIDKNRRQFVLEKLPSIQVLDAAFRDEHCLEVQLPFLQRILGDFELLPILVGDADPLEVQKVLRECWGGPETLIVVSSDLSHFHDYVTAEEMDLHTTLQIESLRPEGIQYQDACGRTPLNGLLLAAKEKNLQVDTVARCNSGDTGGDRQSVVGYGAYAFS